MISNKKNINPDQDIKSNKEINELKTSLFDLDELIKRELVKCDCPCRWAVHNNLHLSRAYRDRCFDSKGNFLIDATFSCILKKC